MSEVTGDIHIAIGVLIGKLVQAKELGVNVNPDELLYEWDQLRGTDWVVTTRNNKSPWDRPAHGYVIVHNETGDRKGGIYTSVGGAKNSFNQRRNGYWDGSVYVQRHFQTQTEYVLKRLVIADE